MGQDKDAAKRTRGQRGIQSIEVGGQLLQCLAQHGQPMALKDLAGAAGMQPAKAHPYLVSLGKLGLIVQDSASSRYGLGPLALQLGLISLQQFDPVRLAAPRIAELASRIGHTLALAVWGNRGPTIVRVEQAPTHVHVNMRHGTVMSLRGTASGRLFAAHLPRELVLAALHDEDRAEGRAPSGPIEAAFEQSLQEVLARGYSHVADTAVPGVSALAAPVFNDTQRLVLGLTVIAPSAALDVRERGDTVVALRRCAAELSAQLGARARN